MTILPWSIPAIGSGFGLGFVLAAGAAVFFGNAVPFPREVDFFAAVVFRTAGLFAVGPAAAALEVAMDFVAAAEG